MDGEDFVIGEEGEMLLEPEAEVDDDDAFEDGENEEVEHDLDSDGDLPEDGEEDTGYEGDMNSDVDDEPELEAAEGEVLVPPRSTGSNGAPSILEEVWNSVFEPGVNSKVVMVMDMCFYGLFGILLALFFASGFNPHVAFLEVVAVCLWVSVKWFLAESAKIQAVEQGNTDPSKPGDTTPADGSVTPSVGNTTPEEAIAPVETKKTI
ncbi:hypothetical protein HK101_006093 [Irineochytrium annulatum]|nr:hypothetical protein HK101_006093 [Irineochytrium annulatum]